MTMSTAAYAQLTPELVLQAVESTGRLSDARVLALNSYENRVYQVGIEDELPVVAKFYRPARWSNDQLREEHAFAGELAGAELPVVAPLADAAGETLFEFEGYRFALFTRKGGQAPEPGNPDQLHRIGMLLGRMHALGQRSAFRHRPTLSVERMLDFPSHFILDEQIIPPTLTPRYRDVVAILRARVLELGPERFRFIRSHGDCHPGNILWTRDDGPWLVDFDDCQAAPAVQDLWMLLAGDRREQELQLAELLDGYRMFCDFDARELVLVEALRSLRLIHYAGWLAMRWSDPAFPHSFPWFNTEAYWLEHVRDLELQVALLNEPPLRDLG